MNTLLSPPVNEETVWIFAFRYAIGRKTTAPWIVSQFLRENIHRVKSMFLDQMANDITHQFQTDDVPEDWHLLLDAIQTELTKRNQ
jgi:hypothetical protein